MAKTDPKGQSADKIGRLLHFASKGDVDSVKSLLDEGLPVDSPDYDGRTAMHLAACGGHYKVIHFLLIEANPTAHVNPVDRWRKTPLADAKWYEKLNLHKPRKAFYSQICRLLIDHGGSTSSPFEIDSAELAIEGCEPDKRKCGEIVEAIWRGTKVSLRILHGQVPYGHNSPRAESELIRQLSLLQSCRHPNIVQFLGAVTKDKYTSLILVTEHLTNGNLHELLHKKRSRIQPKDAVNYALDIAKGMNYLHHHKPEHVVHCELNPMNLVRDEAGHLKVAGINLSKLIGCICFRDGGISARISEIQKVMYKDFDYRSSLTFNPILCKSIYAWYVDPALDREKPNRSADVFAFGRIVYEMFEGPSLANKMAQVAAKDQFVLRQGPPKLTELVMACCHRNPEQRPKFNEIINDLDKIDKCMKNKSWPLQFFRDARLWSWYRLCVRQIKLKPGSITPREDILNCRSRRGARPTTTPDMDTIPEEA